MARKASGVPWSFSTTVAAIIITMTAAMAP